MAREPLSLGKMTSDVKLLMEAMDELKDDQIAIFIYGIYQAQQNDPDITLLEAIEYSNKNWVDLF